MVTVATQNPSSFSLTDLGNAKRMSYYYGENIKYCNPWKKWFLYRDGYWKEDTSNQIHELANTIPEHLQLEAAEFPDGSDSADAHFKWSFRCQSENHLTAMVNRLSTFKELQVKPDDLDADNWKICTLNGIVDLRTGELYDHEKEKLFTRVIPVEYDPNESAPLWGEFLDEVLQGDTDTISFIQKAVGYSLTGDTSEQCFFFMYGTGINGKTTFTETINSLLAEHARVIPAESLVLKVFQNIPNDIARLKGARFALSPEISSGRFDESVIKKLASSDKITARFLGKEFFDFTPTHKLWMYGNHKPTIRGTDTGIWRRIKLIPFTYTIPTEKIDRQMISKLAKELKGIFAWAVQGCLDWQTHGLSSSETIKAAIFEYRTEMDIMGTFLDDNTYKGVSTKIGMGVKSSDLYKEYVKWCQEAGHKPMAQNKFTMELKQRGFKLTSRSDANYWDELKLKSSIGSFLHGDEDEAPKDEKPPF